LKRRIFNAKFAEIAKRSRAESGKENRTAKTRRGEDAEFNREDAENAERKIMKVGVMERLRLSF